MGLLVDGVWSADPTRDADGRFVRKQTSFREWIRADGSTPHAPAAGRYHLYVSLACPWAHRTLVVRKLKKLEDVVSVSILDWHMSDDGWHFSERDGASSSPGWRSAGCCNGGCDTR